MACIQVEASGGKLTELGSRQNPLIEQDDA